jgi:hypothetical protein
MAKKLIVEPIISILLDTVYYILSKTAPNLIPSKAWSPGNTVIYEYFPIKNL